MGIQNKQFLLVLIVVIAAGFAAVSIAATHNVNPSMTTAQIQQTITDSDPNDTINWTEGTYGLSIGQYYNLLQNRDYTFADVTVNGSGLEHGSLFQAQNGGNMNISGNLTLQNAKVGIGIGEVPFDNIRISGLTCYVYDYCIALENRQHSSPLTQAAVVVSDCIANGGIKIVKYNEGLGADANSPYTSVVGCTISNMSSTSGVIDVTTYWDEVNEKWILLGNDGIYNNVFINCIAMSNPDDYTRFESPAENAFNTDVTYPYLKENYDSDPCNNIVEEIGAEDSVGNRIPGPNDYFQTTNTPRRDSRLNLGFGNYIGAIEPYHEVEGNINWDGPSQEIVDLRDWAVAADRYGLTTDMNDVLPVINDWLVIEPNDPNGNPKL